MKFSSAERSDFYNTNFMPGPGHYETPNAQQPRNIPRGRKPVPSTAFGQVAARFNYSDKDGLNIGPGHYFGINEWTNKPKKEQKPHMQQNTRKIVTIPSIPSTTHAMGYVEREDGYLVPLNGTMLKENEDMGPGVYNPVDNMTKKRVKGFSLEKHTSPRFPMKKIVEEAKPEPEIYELNKRETIEKETILRKKIEPKKKPETCEPKIERIDDTPVMTAGYYYNEKLASSFKVQNKPPEFQNFGSTAKRFITAKNTSSAPGPGAYDGPTIDTSNLIQNGLRAEPFSKGDMRFRSGLPNDLPGPGMYDANFNMTPAGALSNAHTNFSAAFGSGSGRFAAQKVHYESTPGPGSYDIKKPKKKNKQKRTKLAVPPGYYSSNNIDSLKSASKTLEFDLGGRTKGAVTVKFEQINRGTSVFNPVVPRFKEDVIRDENPGPGAYHFNDKNMFLKQSFKSTKENFALASRDQSNKVDAYKMVLGPGMYDPKIDMTRHHTNFIPKINPMSMMNDLVLSSK